MRLNLSHMRCIVSLNKCSNNDTKQRVIQSTGISNTFGEKYSLMGYEINANRGIRIKC